MLCAASTTNKAPSQAAIDRETSYEKSTWPGVSIKLKTYSSPPIETSIWMACDLMVIPRSRSKSILSRSWSCFSRSVTAPVASNSLSASVLLPWSICAMMQKFRMCFIAEVNALVRKDTPSDHRGVPLPTKKLIL